MFICFKNIDLTLILKTSFSQNFIMKIHVSFGEDIKLMSDKVLKVWCRYLEPFSSYSQYPGGWVKFTHLPSAAWANSHGLVTVPVIGAR